MLVIEIIKTTTAVSIIIRCSVDLINTLGLLLRGSNDLTAQVGGFTYSLYDLIQDFAHFTGNVNAVICFLTGEY
jgi:hypothetical protein